MATRKAFIRMHKLVSIIERNYDEINYKHGGIIELKRDGQIMISFNSINGYVSSTEPVEEPRPRKKGFGNKDN